MAARPVYLPKDAESRDRFLSALAYDYDHGRTVREIADGIGCTYATAHRYLRLAGIKLRARGYRPGTSPGWSDTARAAAIETRRAKSARPTEGES